MMTVEGRRTRVFEILSFQSRGRLGDTYLKPRRDRHQDACFQSLWIYMPNVDRVQKISGHMLRQGMMGRPLVRRHDDLGKP